MTLTEIFIAVLILAAIVALYKLLTSKGASTSGSSGSFVSPAPFPNPNNPAATAAVVQGAWTTAPGLLETSSPQEEFQWHSYQVNWAHPNNLMPDLAARAIHFELQGNPLVKIVSISSPGAMILNNGRTGIGATDSEGKISVFLNVVAGDGSSGSLWGIDEGLTPPCGAEARFEVR